MKLKDYVTSDPEILGGQMVFKGTRVPVESLFDHLAAGYAINEFLGEFPSVTYGQAEAVLKIAAELINNNT